MMMKKIAWLIACVFFVILLQSEARKSARLTSDSRVHHNKKKHYIRYFESSMLNNDIKVNVRNNVPKPSKHKVPNVKYPPPSNMWKINNELSQIEHNFNGGENINETITDSKSVNNNNTFTVTPNAVLVDRSRTGVNLPPGYSLPIVSRTGSSESPNAEVKSTEQLRNNSAPLTLNIEKTENTLLPSQGRDTVSTFNNRNAQFLIPFSNNMTAEPPSTGTSYNAQPYINNSNYPNGNVELLSARENNSLEKSTQSKAFIQSSSLPAFSSNIHSYADHKLPKKSSKATPTIHYPKPVFAGITMISQNLRPKTNVSIPTVEQSNKLFDERQSSSFNDAVKQKPDEMLKPSSLTEEKPSLSNPSVAYRTATSVITNTNEKLLDNTKSMFAPTGDTQIATMGDSASQKKSEAVLTTNTNTPLIDDKNKKGDVEDANKRIEQEEDSALSEENGHGYDYDVDDNVSESFAGETSPTGKPKLATSKDTQPKQKDQEKQENDGPSEAEINHQKAVEFVSHENNKMASIVQQNGIAAMSDLEEPSEPFDFSNKLTDRTIVKSNDTLKLTSSNDPFYNGFPSNEKAGHSQTKTTDSNRIALTKTYDEKSGNIQNTASLSTTGQKWYPLETINGIPDRFAGRSATERENELKKDTKMMANRMDYLRGLPQPQQQSAIQNFQNGFENTAVQYPNDRTIFPAYSEITNTPLQQYDNLLNQPWLKYTDLNANSKSSYETQRNTANDVAMQRYHLHENPVTSDIDSKSGATKKGTSVPDRSDFLQKESLNSQIDKTKELNTKLVSPESLQPLQTKPDQSGISTLRLPVPHGPSIAFDETLPLLASRSIKSSGNAKEKSKVKTKTKASSKASGSAASLAKSKADAWSNGKTSASMSQQMAGNQQKLAEMQQKVQELRHNTYKGQRTSYGWGQGQGFGYGKTSYGRGGGHAWAGDNWERQNPKPYRYPSPNGNSPNQAPANGAQPAPPAVSNGDSSKVASQPQPSGPITGAAQQVPQYLQPKPSKPFPVALKENKLSGNKIKPASISDGTDRVLKKLKNKKNNYAQEQATGSGHGEGYGNKESWGQGGGYAWAGKAPPQGAPNPADFLQRPASLPVLPNVPGGSSGEGSYSNSGGVDSSGPEQETEEQPQETPEDPQTDEPEQSQEQPEQSQEQPQETPEQQQETPEQPQETPEQPQETAEPPEATAVATAEYYNKTPNNIAKIHKTYKNLKNKLKGKFKNAADDAAGSLQSDGFGGRPLQQLRRKKKVKKTFQNNPWRSPRYDDND